MNLPNKITVLRVFLIPIFIFMMLCHPFGTISKYIATGIFVFASATDFLDGLIARKYNLVTNFGKFADPLADKLLVGAALILLSDSSSFLPGDGTIPAWIVIIIISREFIISGLRTLAADAGIVLAAGWWGKVKTVCQMVMIVLIIINIDFWLLDFLEVTSVYLSLFFTIFSMIDYLYKNKSVFKDN